ncbi:hypothetical protein [Deminuibacter soli]|uniref:Glycine zipper family protein n=1 Tax=Deminuibacter soli TaxID=2291815 RepID=A0A3E1NQS3_9BACT|nr:hypothetical protein [Deminuibacter soli]RFM30271.1 hypothetical protein DXN05_04700 [Deminuibacter soli]
MKNCLLIVLLGFVAQRACAQEDFVLLKKGDRTIERYYSGSNIYIYTTYDQYLKGIVDKCRNDSIFIKVQSTEMVPTMYGSKPELINWGTTGVALKEIAIVPHKRISMASVGNTLVGAAFIAGGIIGINSIHTTEKGDYAIAYFATAGLGFLVSQIHFFKQRKPLGYTIGKKYHLEYVNMTK